MPRPLHILNEKIIKWSDQIDNDKSLSPTIANNPIIREVCYAGLYLAEELEKLKCPDEIITRIRYTAGSLSYGRDIWEIHEMILNKYINNELEFEEDYSELN